MSLFTVVESVPPIEALETKKLTKDFQGDAHPQKVLLGSGVYRKGDFFEEWNKITTQTHI